MEIRKCLLITQKVQKFGFCEFQQKRTKTISLLKEVRGFRGVGPTGDIKGSEPLYGQNLPLCKILVVSKNGTNYPTGDFELDRCGNCEL